MKYILMEREIIDLIQDNKNDKNLYLLTFNILTENNTLKNFSHNNNGIFFNISEIKQEKLKILLEEIKKFIETKKNIVIEEGERCKLMEKMTNSLSSCIKTELKEILNHKNGIYSTEISKNEYEENKKLEIDEKVKNKRMKKSIDEFLKPINLKNSRLRIHKVINNTSKKHRNTLNKISKEFDDLYNEEVEYSFENDEEIDDNFEKESHKSDIEEEHDLSEEESRKSEINDEELFGEEVTL